MKTKIIYISGGEIFNMNDVRDAFETVRRELNLGMDTVLFGVPVDAEDALGGQFESKTDATNVIESVPAQKDIVEPVEKENVDIDVPVKKATKRTKKKVIEETVEEIVSGSQIVDEEKPEIIKEIEPVADETSSTPNKEVISILSVLNTDDVNNDADLVSGDQDDTKDDIKDIDLSIDILDQEPDLATQIVDEFDANNVDDKIATVETQVMTVNEIDEEDSQLEKLLQSVQSLHEDKDETAPELQVIDNTIDETDATLEKLANEFVENQDKIENTTKSSARGGRIGKLKNILPFKKAKRNESSLMGDLFGWAGVAANDEEFAIPEFFPTAVKK